MLGTAGRASARHLARALAALACAWLLLSQHAVAQTFPQLTGRIVDAANIIPADEKARLEQKLAALEQQSQRQLVVATIPDLQGYDIADYGYRLGRAWGLGDKRRNDGALLIVAPHEHKVRIEVGYGLEGILTDGLSSLIISQEILPRFKGGDIPGGIEAGTDALIKQLTLPDDQARQIAAQAKPQRAAQDTGGVGLSTIVWLAFLFFFILLPMLRHRRSGFGGALGQVMLWNTLGGMGGRGGWGGGGGGFGGGGGGGFSGGGGSFGGGGASGSW